jgi:hypothetical protein
MDVDKNATPSKCMEVFSLIPFRLLGWSHIQPIANALQKYQQILSFSENCKQLEALFTHLPCLYPCHKSAFIDLQLGIISGTGFFNDLDSFVAPLMLAV